VFAAIESNNMKPIEKDELYEHLGQFLKSKGIEMKEGSYTKSIQAGCSLLADAINLSQAGIERAKTELDKNLERVRQVIHEKTAPKSARTTAPAAPPPIIQTNKASAPPNGNQRPKRKAKRANRRKPKTHGS
jgi:hypothetical protein